MMEEYQTYYVPSCEIPVLMSTSGALDESNTERRVTIFLAISMKASDNLFTINHQIISKFVGSEDL